MAGPQVARRATSSSTREGILRTLRFLSALAHGWHQSGWSIWQVPARIGTELHVRRGGRKILGFSLELGGFRQIVLNDRIIGTSLAVPVLAHECAHLLVGLSGLGLCETRVDSRKEQEAWYGAALLAVPLRHLERWRQGMPLADLATALAVPPEFVNLRIALGGYLEADASECAAMRRRLGVAWTEWRHCLEREAAALS